MKKYKVAFYIYIRTVTKSLQFIKISLTFPEKFTINLKSMLIRIQIIRSEIRSKIYSLTISVCIFVINN